MPADDAADVATAETLTIRPVSDDAGGASICGHYIRLPLPGRYKEPNFVNKRSRLFLFQRQSGEWVVSSRRGGSSHRANAGATLAGRVVWTVYDGEAWTRAELECIGGGAAEPRVKLATAVIVQCRFDNLAGLYRLHENGATELPCEAWNLKHVMPSYGCWTLDGFPLDGCCVRMTWRVQTTMSSPCNGSHGECRPPCHHHVMGHMESADHHVITM